MFFSKKFSVAVLITILIISGIAAFYTTQITPNYDFDAFFPQNDEDTEFFKDYREVFENDNDFLLLGFEHDTNVFTAPFLEKINKTTQALEKLTLTEAVISPTNFSFRTKSGLKVPLVHVKDYSRIKTDSIFTFQQPDVIGTLLSQDRKGLCILVKTQNMIIRDSAHVLLQQVEDIIASSGIAKTHLAGKIKAEKYYVGIMEKEIVLFVVLSWIIITVFLFLAFRSIWGITIPMLVVLLSVIWTTGLMGMKGDDLDIMSILIPTILFIVGISDVIHIMSKYLEELRNDKTIVDALKVTIKEVGLATLLTSITTALGFLTLLTASIVPVQNFGLITAIGVILAFIIAFTFLPAILLLLPKPKISYQKKATFWHKKLHINFLWILKNKLKIAIGAIVVIIISIIGICQIEINVLLIDEVNDGDELKNSFVFMDEKFGGARPFELSMNLKDSTKSFFDEDVIKEIESTQHYLDSAYGVRNMISPTTIFYYSNRAMEGGEGKHYTLPSSKKDFKRTQKMVKKFLKKGKFKNIITSDGLRARITGRMKDVGSLKTEILNQKFNATIQSDLIDYRLTGSPGLIDKNNSLLSVNMLEGLLIAFVAIALLMGLLYKSFRMVLVAIIPNILPLLIIGACIGFSGIGLKISTSIVFTIAFGIAVDDTIHFMSKLKIELGKGKSLLYAMKRTFISTGKAIIITSFILVAGFGVLMISMFNGTFYIGILISITLFIAVLSDLLLIPVLLIYLSSKKKYKKK